MIDKEKFKRMVINKFDQCTTFEGLRESILQLVDENWGGTEKTVEVPKPRTPGRNEFNPTNTTFETNSWKYTMK